MSLCKAARPIEMKQGSGTAFLLVHGYTGYPGELTRPARDLYALGYDVYAPRLPGHGTDGDDFSKSRAEDWLGTVVEEARKLKGSYGRLYMLGHSMGAALVVIASGPVRPDKLVLAAPAVSCPGEKKPVSVPLLRLISLVKKRSRTKWQNDPGFVMYYEDAPADDLYLGGEYWSWVYYRQLLGLFTLMDMARDAAPSLDVPSLIIAAGKDQIMGPQGAEYLSRVVKGSKRVVIPGATHYLFYDKDKTAEEEAVRTILDWVGKADA